MKLTQGFKIIGIAVRTTNKDNQSAQDIPKLWERFLSENLTQKIPNKKSEDIMTIYTDYTNDYTEDYTAILGIPVTTLDNIPEGFVGREFLAEKFQKFIAKGEMPNAVVNTWMHIWQNDHKLNRKYNYDVEIYGDKCNNGANSEVEILISTQ